MVHRVYPLFLPFCKLYGFIYIVPVFSRRAALFIIGKTVCVLLRLAAASLIDVIKVRRVQLVPAVVLRCLRLYQLPARSVLLFSCTGAVSSGKLTARLLLLRAVW